MHVATYTIIRIPQSINILKNNKRSQVKFYNINIKQMLK